MLVADIRELLRRLAIISDLHGNLPAVEAILEDVARQGRTGVLCLGNYVGYAPLHREVVETLRRRGAVMLQGNLDAVAASQGKRPHVVGQLDEGFRLLLADLPLAARLRLEDVGVVAFHGELSDVSPLFNEDPRLAAELHVVSRYAVELETLDEGSLFEALAEHLSADAYVFGHAQRAMSRHLGGKQFVGVPSAGRPRGDVRTGYALLTAQEGELRVEFRKVAYDVQAAVRAIKAHGFPSHFAEELQSPPD